MSRAGPGRYTDDAVLTVAVASAILHGRDYGSSMREWRWRYVRSIWLVREEKVCNVGHRSVPSADAFARSLGLRLAPRPQHPSALLRDAQPLADRSPSKRP